MQKRNGMPRGEVAAAPHRPNNPFILNLERRDRLSAVEIAIVEDIASHPIRIAARHEIVAEGAQPGQSCLLLDGFAARYNLIGDGRRQITAIHCGGEFVDLHSFLLSRMDHSVVALTSCVVAIVPHSRLSDIVETEPHLARMLWLLTLVDAAIYRRWLIAAGRKTSAGQIAHFLCEMYVRLSVTGKTEGLSFRLPLSQGELGDTMGLSVVHVNRTVRELRERGLIAWQGDEVRILDWPRLARLAEFDPAYLDLRPSPR